MRAVALCPPLLAILLTACGGKPTPGPVLQGPGRQGPPQPPAVEFDFGVIPHGESRQHDYVLDTKLLGADYVPLRAQLDCSCGRAQIVLRDKQGNERLVDGSPASVNAPTADETLIARVFLDTVTKDAVDLPRTTSRGSILLQPLHDRDGSLQAKLFAAFSTAHSPQSGAASLKDLLCCLPKVELPTGLGSIIYVDVC